MPRTAPANQTDILLTLLRETRRGAGVTQAALAEALGLRQTDISKVERGDRRLDILELRAWAEAVGAPFLALMHELDLRLAAQDAVHAQALGSAAIRKRSKT